MRESLLNPDDILRRRPWTVGGDASGSRRFALVLNVVLFGVIYGAVMGCYGLYPELRWKQIVFSALKVPLLLCATVCISLPSFYVVNVLLGLAGDFRRVLRSIFAAQATVAIVLAAMAPFTALYYASSSSYRGAIMFNAFIFALASLAGQFALRGYYQPLMARRPRHRWMSVVWTFLYALVGIQMGWVLRPFIGSTDVETQFFRAEGWSNAYVALWRMVAG